MRPTRAAVAPVWREPLQRRHLAGYLDHHPWTLPGQPGDPAAPGLHLSNWCRVDGQCLIPGGRTGESVMGNAPASPVDGCWSSCKGADLELLQLQKHPFMDFDVPAILGEHVTLDAGTGAVAPPRQAMARRLA